MDLRLILPPKGRTTDCHFLEEFLCKLEWLVLAGWEQIWRAGFSKEDTALWPSTDRRNRWKSWSKRMR